MSNILIKKIPQPLKEEVERHSEYHRGNCNEYYLNILNRFVNSPEFQLDLARQRIRRLEGQVEWLTKDVERHKRTADMFKRLYSEALKRAMPAALRGQTAGEVQPTNADNAA